MRPIKVVLIDDHHLIHDAVGSKLAGSSEFQLVGQGTCGEELEPLIERHRPDVVLLNLGLPIKVGTTIRQGRYQTLPAVKRLRQQYPETQFVILSAHADPSLVDGALAVEVKGYLLKDDELSVNLLDAIRAVSKGGVYFSSELSEQVFSKKPPRPAVDLSERQMEVLHAMVQNPGEGYAGLAEKVGVAENTIRSHVRVIYEKLEVNSEPAAIVKAIQLGLIPPHLLGRHDT
ncbi:MAG: response regulator transcription factor [Anaerolineales bacterium]|nr:response regulator transcription factor [Anaerolineales bacterium]